MKGEVQMEEVSSEARNNDEGDTDPLILSRREKDDDGDHILLHENPSSSSSVGVLRLGVAGYTEIVQDDDDDDQKDDHRDNDEDDGDDLEAGSAPCCRICLEADADEGDELISPCMCRGTQQFVHRSCLDQWRSVKEGFSFSHCTTCKAHFHLRVQLFEDNVWRTFKFRLFVARDILLVFFAVQTVIVAMGGLAYLMDRDGSFRNSFSDDWDRILSKHPIPFYYCVGVVLFLVLLGFGGLVLNCFSMNSNDSHMAAGCQNCFYGWGTFPASVEACFMLVIVFVVIFAILGIAYSFLAATMAIQRIWQRHYHILTKRELTKEYVVEDLHGCYTPPKLEPEHEERLKALKLL